MPTMATFMQLLPAGFQGKTSRCTDSTVYCVVEGRGPIGEQEFHFGPRDVFVAPSWQPAAAGGAGRRHAVQLFRPPGAGRAGRLAQARA